MKNLCYYCGEECLSNGECSNSSCFIFKLQKKEREDIHDGKSGGGKSEPINSSSLEHTSDNDEHPSTAGIKKQEDKS